jgi:hypothetical protein
MTPPDEPFDKESGKALNELLGRVVTPDGYVDWDALEADRQPLDAYISWLSSERAWQGRITKEWHAQYLNAYNMLVLWQVLERGRPASVHDVKGMIPVDGWKFFSGTQFELGVEWLTLSEIENERIRWKEMDYRDHAALNCASMGCPPLRNELYRLPALQSQLDDQMQRWIMDDVRGVRIEDGVAVFSPIFDWYARDFEFFSAGQDLCELAAEHAIGEKQQQLRQLAGRGCPHRFSEYDWSLNDAEKVGQ